jgi:hypothetical protein
MKRPFLSLAAVVALSAPLALAENYEFTLLGGGSFTNKKTITGPAGTADAGFKSGFAGGVAFGNNMYKLVGGEVRYTYQKHDMKLDSSSTHFTFGAESHSVHYDLLVHATPRGSHVRPYLAAGGGVKFFRGTGKETATQPLQNIAVLTHTHQVEGLISVGGGVKFEISQSAMIRIDVHDYISPVPQDLLAPVPPGKISGWLHNFVPVVGVAFTF